MKQEFAPTQLIITLPDNNQQSKIYVPQHVEIVLQFDQATASFERVDDNLVIEGHSENSVILQDFFIVEEEGAQLPNLVLHDGSIVSSEHFLATFNMDTSISTAAGPSQSPTSGLNAYDSDTGSLVDGIDRLGSLGSTTWDSQQKAQDTVLSTNATTTGTEANPTGPDTEISDTTYSSRVVIYLQNGNVPQLTFKVADPSSIRSSAPTPTFTLLGSNGKPVSGFIDPSNATYNPATGEWTLGFDSAALQAAMPNNGSNLYEYVQISVGGKTYIMQVVFNDSGVFDSVAEDANITNGGFTLDGALINGEYHTGYTPNNPTIDSSSLDDTVTLMNNLSGATINTNAGNDVVTINGTVLNSTIALGDGDNTLETGALNAGGKVISDDGADTITVNGNFASTALISTGDGNDSVTLNGTKMGEILMGDGDDYLHITGNVSSAKVTDMGNGTNTLLIGGAVANTGMINLGNDSTTAIIEGKVTGRMDGGTGLHSVTINGGIGAKADLKLNDGTLDIKQGAHVSGYFHGKATIDAKNTNITVEGARNIDKESSGLLARGNATAKSNAVLVINTQGNLTVNTESETLASTPIGGARDKAYGLDARFNSSLIDLTVGGAVVVNAEATDRAVSFYNSGTSSIDVKAGSIASTAHSHNEYAHGVESSDSAGLVSLKAQDSIDLKVFANSGAYGIKSNNASLTAEKGDINILASANGAAHAITAHNSTNNDSTITILAKEGNISVDAQSKGGGANALAQMTGAGASIDWNLESTQGNVVLKSSVDQTSNNTGDFSVGTTVGIYKGKLDITAGKDIVIDAEIKAGRAGTAAVSNAGTSEFNLTAGESILSTTKTLDGKAQGMSFTDNSKATFIAKNIDLKTLAGAGDATTLTVNNTTAHANAGVSMTANTISIAANGGGVVNAISVTNGLVNLVAPDVTIEAISTAGNQAYALHTTAQNSYGAHTNITGNNVAITAESTADTTYAMYALSSTSAPAHNSISALDDHAITVTITAQSGTVDKAYAMWAQGANAVNQINGSTLADSVSITGEIFADANGVNIISTKDGDDTITLHGKIHSSGSLTLDAGAGTDTLVLVADNSADFFDYYKDWLEASFDTMSIETIQVNIHGLDDAELANLEAFFGSNIFDNIPISYVDTAAGVMYLDKMFGLDGSLALEDLFDVNHGNITQFDMTGSSANELRIDDSSLNTLRGMENITITGDNNDTVTLASGWQVSGSTQINDTTYNQYTNGDTSLLIMQEMVVSITG